MWLGWYQSVCIALADIGSWRYVQAFMLPALALSVLWLWHLQHHHSLQMLPSHSNSCATAGSRLALFWGLWVVTHMQSWLGGGQA
jgi:hypothetical protein